MMNVIRFFFLVSIDNTFIYEAKIYEDPTSNADFTHVVFQCIAHESLQNDFEGDLGEYASFSNTKSSYEPVSSAANEHSCTFGLALYFLWLV